MKLYLNGSSPYSRLVRIILTETGLAESCEYVWVDPWSEPVELLAVSPSAKIPALLTGEGPALVESRVICDYLIERSGRRDLQAADVHSLQILGLAQATMDCAFGAVIQQQIHHPGIGHPPLDDGRGQTPHGRCVSRCQPRETASDHHQVLLCRAHIPATSAK